MKISLKINVLVKIKEFILSMSLIILITYFYYKMGSLVVIASSSALFYYGLSLALAMSVFRLVGQYLFLLFTSKIIIEAYQKKQKVAPIYGILPSIFEIIIDMVLLYVWNYLFSSSVYFFDFIILVSIIFFMRFFTRMIDASLLWIRKRKEKM